MLFSFCLSVLAKETPFINTYSKTEYNAGQWNRDFIQDKRGNLYIANSEGLLTFDGINFNLYPIKNKTQVLALGIDENQKIYVGGQGELGYFYPNSNGLLEYHSLKEIIPKEYQNFSDIRKICVTSKGVYFKELLNIFYLDFNTNQIEVLQAGSLIDYIDFIDGKLYVDTKDKGILLFNQGAFQKVEGGDIFNEMEVSSFLKWNNQVFISTWKKGLFVFDKNKIIPYNKNISKDIVKKQIKTAVVSPKNELVLGTVLGGVYILNQEGVLVDVIDKESGLKNNFIEKIYYDQFNNLWVGLENGINYVKIGEPFKLINPNPEQELIGYAARIHQDVLYLATSLGLYYKKINKGISYNEEPFQLMDGAEGLCWNLSVVNEELYLHKHDGFYKVENQNVRAINNNNEGSWIAMPLKGSQDKMLEGTYFGINIYKNNQFVKTLNFEESSRIIEQTDNAIWISHDYKGAFKVEFDKDNYDLKSFKYYNHEKGFPTDIDINVFKINNEIVFTSEQGIFKYDNVNDSIVPHKVLNDIFESNSSLKRLVQDNRGNLWFVEDKKVGYIDVNAILSEGDIDKIYLPQVEGLLVEHFQHIYTGDNESVYFGSENGFVSYQLNQFDFYTDSLFNTNLNKVRIGFSLDSIIYNGNNVNNNSVNINYSLNNIDFEFSSNYFSDLENLYFSSNLKGYEEDWTEWTIENKRTFTNLSPGNYEFLVKSLNSKGVESSVVAYKFTILSPWYLTTLAKLVYVLLGVFGIYLIWSIPRKQHELETQSLKEKQRKQLESQEKEFSEKVKESEKELIYLRNEKLKNEVNFKNKELASLTMHLVQKSEILLKIKEELLKINKTKESNDIKNNIRKVVRTIEKDLKFDNNWNNFEKYFDQVHTDFIKILREKYPQLTTKDYKLCAYLRMNLSSKEIASLMNITTRSVEVSRYRLRKRLNLEKEDNLTDFIMDI